MVLVEPGTADPAGALPGAGVGEVAVIDVVVMGAQVAAQLAADRRRRTPEPSGDLAHAMAATVQGRDALAFQQ